MDLLRPLLKASAVSAWAGPRSYSRGLDYYFDERVELRSVDERRVSAAVDGAQPYDVELVAEDGRLQHSCSCPMGAEGHFCKHCVAVALSLTVDPMAPTTDGATDERADGSDVRTYLESLDQEELVDLLADRAAEDWRLRERIVARMAKRGDTTLGGSDWRRHLESVLIPGDFVSYHDAPAWADEVREVLDAIDELVDAGHAEAVIELTEYGYGLAEAAVQFVDDSDGWIMGFIDQLTRTHLRASTIGGPEPVAFARRLAELELSAEYGGFSRAAQTYAHVLLVEGLDEYRRIVEPRWQAARQVGDPYSTALHGAREAMAGVALAVGEIDEFIEVKQASTLGARDYEEIVGLLREEDRSDDAVAWARRGVSEFADRPWLVGNLHELLAELLQETGTPGQAVEVFWDEFDARPSLGSYRRLLREAEHTGDVDEWRERALATERARVASGDAVATSGRLDATLADALVEILLDEGHSAEAWDVAAAHGCADRIWLSLAEVRGLTHPSDAIPVYEREAWASIEAKNKTAYRSAVGHLARVRDLSQAAGTPDVFETVLAEVRDTHKRKRNLMALLDERGW